jgi:hypothetical protein
MFDLALTVERVQLDRTAFSFVRRQAIGILTHLGISESWACEWLNERCQGTRIADLASFEASLRADLERQQICQTLPGRMEERAKAVAALLTPHLSSGPILDLGAGSGEIAWKLKESGFAVTVADVFNWTKYPLPFVRIEDNVVPGSYEQVMVLMVFHHSDNVEKLLSHAFRAASRKVLIIESVTEDRLGFAYGCWIDWFYNRVIHYSKEQDRKIHVPCNFLSASCWSQLIWKLTGLTPALSEPLGIFQHLNPELHHLLVYEI